MEAQVLRDAERIRRIGCALRQAGLDALVCTSPMDVLLLSGYWPVVGTSVAIATREERVVVLAPEDEYDLAVRSGADEVRLFRPASLHALCSVAEVISDSLGQAIESLGLTRGRIGYESGAYFEPSSYAAMYSNGGMAALLNRAAPVASPAPADHLLACQRSVKTPAEISHLRAACQIAEQAFAEGARGLQPGLMETEAAALFRAPLSTRGIGHVGVQRAEGFAFCMSGPNAALASAAYQRSRDRRLEEGDLALVHCNSCADGYWTDVTRTYCVGDCDERQAELYEAVCEARQAALDAIRPGARGSDVDRAARDVLNRYGFGAAFRHSTGHGVGFAAIDHNALPRLHPCSSDTLKVGMVFNVEPAVYFDGYGGLRHCDMVAVTEGGVEVLTPFAVDSSALVLPGKAEPRMADHDFCCGK